MTNVLVEKNGAIALVTFNRPHAMNALSSALRREFAAAVADLERDEDIKVLILTGAGDKAFTAGMDLKELAEDPAAIAGANGDTPELNPVLAIGTCSKPVICALNGVAAAGGFEVALACDVIIASRTARLADTHVRVGVLPGWGLSQRLSRLIGPYRAKELSLTGNFLDATTAADWGLVNRVVEPAELLPAARALAADMAQVQLSMLVGMKQLIDEGYRLAFADALAFETATTTPLNARVSTGDVEANRLAVLARGRTQ